MGFSSISLKTLQTICIHSTTSLTHQRTNIVSNWRSASAIWCKYIRMQNSKHFVRLKATTHDLRKANKCVLVNHLQITYPQMCYGIQWNLRVSTFVIFHVENVDRIQFACDTPVSISWAWIKLSNGQRSVGAISLTHRWNTVTLSSSQTYCIHAPLYRSLPLGNLIF